MNEASSTASLGTAAEDAVAVRPSERVAIRFGASLISNAVRLGLSMASGLLVARGMGVSQYGDYQFLLASVAGIAQFIDLGTSQAFYTFVARQRRTARFATIYAGWLALQFIVVIAAIGIATPARLIAALWLGHERWIILLAFAATFLMNELWEAVAQMGEARRRTVLVQSAVLLQAAAHFVLVAGAVFMGRLSIPLMFTFIACEYGALILFLGPRFLRDTVTASEVAGESFRDVVAEFYRYCRPLFLYALCSFIVLFADRWLLQRFGGSSQQGFFSLGQQFSTVSLLATTALLQVFWKEVAAATTSGDHARTVALYRTTTRALYFGAAWMSCLLIPYSADILRATVGAAYLGGTIPFALMLMYPLHQALGRITGSFFHAIGDTAAYSRIGIATTLLSLPIAYVLLAPRSAVVPGLDLGATGMSLKMLAINVLAVNLSAFAIARRLGTTYDWGHQVTIVALLLALAFGCRVMAHALMGWIVPSHDMLASVSGAIAYATLSALALFRYPAAVGLSRTQARAIARGYRDFFRNGES